MIPELLPSLFTFLKGTEYKAKAEDLKVNLTRYHELEKSVKEKREELRKVSEKYDAIMV